MQQLRYAEPESRILCPDCDTGVCRRQPDLRAANAAAAADYAGVGRA
jgi:hypothetical protein